MLCLSSLAWEMRAGRGERGAGLASGRALARGGGGPLAPGDGGYPGDGQLHWSHAGAQLPATPGLMSQHRRAQSTGL